MEREGEENPFAKNINEHADAMLQGTQEANNTNDEVLRENKSNLDQLKSNQIQDQNNHSYDEISIDSDSEEKNGFHIKEKDNNQISQTRVLADLNTYHSTIQSNRNENSINNSGEQNNSGNEAISNNFVQNNDFMVNHSNNSDSKHQNPCDKGLNRLDIQAIDLLSSNRSNQNGIFVGNNNIPNFDEINHHQENNIISLKEEDDIPNIMFQILNISKKNCFMKEAKEREYGVQLLYSKKQPIKDNSGSTNKSLNPFFLKYDTFGKYVQYFSDNIPYFVSKRVIRIKKRIFVYIQMLINEVIINKEMQLLSIDYDDVIKPINAKFNLELLNSKIGDIFIKYQKSKNTLDFCYNDEVIDYIKQNEEKEELANYLINLEFKNIVKLFIMDKKNGLKYYLEIVAKEVIKEIEHNKKKFNQHNINKIMSIKRIDEKICGLLEEYFQSIKQRKIVPRNKNKNDEI